jgi:hypothetical protein
MGMDPLTIGLLSGMGGMVASQMLAPNMTPDIKPPPQASKSPDVQSVAAGQAGQGQAGGAPGVAQTFLTGSGGIDPSLLQLGKKTLLGGG